MVVACAGTSPSCGTGLERFGDGLRTVRKYRHHPMAPAVRATDAQPLHILCGVDASAGGQAAANVAGLIAHRMGAHLTLVHSVATTPGPASARRAAATPPEHEIRNVWAYRLPAAHLAHKIAEVQPAAELNLQQSNAFPRRASARPVVVAGDRPDRRWMGRWSRSSGRCG